MIICIWTKYDVSVGDSLEYCSQTNQMYCFVKDQTKNDLIYPLPDN